MITTAISSILAMAGAGIIHMAVSYFYQTINTIGARSDIISAMYQIRLALSNAMDLRYVDSGGGAINWQRGQAQRTERVWGQLRSGVFGGSRGVRNVIAVFNRETNLAGNMSEASPTALVYQEPQVNVVGGAFGQISGALWIYRMGGGGVSDLGSAHQVDLTRNSFRVPRLVQLSVPQNQMRAMSPGTQPVVRADTNIQDGDMMVSAQLNLRFRLNRGSNPNNWCWQPAIAACGGNWMGGRDVAQSITISFRNNRVYEQMIAGRNNGYKRDFRILGGLYFFQATGPTGFR